MQFLGYAQAFGSLAVELGCIWQVAVLRPRLLHSDEELHIRRLRGPEISSQALGVEVANELGAGHYG